MSSALRKPVIVAGILLEWTPVEVALQTLSMTRSELEKVLAACPEWPYPACQDAWRLFHNAIRYDMDALQTAICTTKAQVYNGEALGKWQVDALHRAISEFCHHVYQHHEYEEEIMFPWMETWVQLPPKMSADHLTLLSLIEKVRDLSEGLRPAESAAAKAPMNELSVAFDQLRTFLRQHLEEEEILGLPLLRKHFTARQAAVLERAMMAQMKARDLAWFLRPMDNEDKQLMMSRFRIPGLVQRLVMLPACRKDEATLVQAYRDLAAGQKQQVRLPTNKACGAKSSRTLLACFAA